MKQINYLYTIDTEKPIGNIKKIILKLLGITFVNSYKSKERGR